MTEKKNDIVTIFEKLLYDASLDIQEAAKKGKITRFEEKVFFLFLCGCNFNCSKLLEF